LRLCSTITLDPLPGEGFAIYKKETWIGSNAARVDIALSGESISEVHACVVNEEGSFRLQDAGSVSGTWLNYSPVPARSSGLASEPVGVPIESGDLIQIGRVPLLFEIYQAKPPQIQVLPYQELE
jgi:pSer/pThr/pTyr-binding forkhead associated (FHA) protein